MEIRIPVSWLVLALALTVPGGLYYLWHSRQAEAQGHETSIRVRLPPGGPFATNPQPSGRPKLPAAEAPLPAVLPAASVAVQPTPTASAAKPEPAPAPAAEGHPEWRDPTLSFFDYLRLERQAAETRARQEEIGKALVKARTVESPKVASIEQSIRLEGIIGYMAIVNGKAVREGDIVDMATVLRITSQAVWFGYKGKRFSKSMEGP